MRIIILTISSLAMFCQLVQAEAIRLSSKHFKNKDFIESFSGSYGFLAPVEPKVDREESEILAEAGEFFQKGQFKTVENKLASFVRRRQSPDPENPEAKPKGVSPAMVFILGNLYFQSDRQRDAERSYLEAIRRFPSFRRAHKNLALLYASQGELEKALPSLNKAIQLGDSDHRSFGMLGYCYLQKQQPVAAESAYRHATLLKPTEKDWQTGLVQSLVMQEKWKESIGMLKKLLKETPEKKELWSLLVNARLSLGEKMSAAQTIEMMRYQGIADSGLLKLLGDIYMDQSQPVLALGAYIVSMQKSENKKASGGLTAARILLDYGAETQAEKYLQAYDSEIKGEMAPEEKVEMLTLRARIAEKRDDLLDAVTYLNEALEADPMNGTALVFLGRVYEREANESQNETSREEALSKARVTFKRALEVEGSVYEANLRFGQMLVRQRNFEDALPHLKRAQSLKQGKDSLARYVRRVEAAAGRSKLRREQEEKAREIRKAGGVE